MEVASVDYHYLQIGTPLHDIGKIGIDDAILRKPGRLSTAEFAEIQAHPTKGVAILARSPNFGAILPIVGSHHEHWDGSGYPDGLIGEVISPLALIVTVADVFDALTCDRPYRKAVRVFRKLSATCSEMRARCSTRNVPRRSCDSHTHRESVHGSARPGPDGRQA